MSSIIITRPINIQLDVIETDDYMPSIRMEANIEIKYPTGKVLYQADDIWLECRLWDNFVTNLNDITTNNRGEASLDNMSSNFKIKLICDGSTITFRLEIQENNADSGEVFINYSSLINMDVFSQIQCQFVEFEKWW